ncbi:MAG: type II secretion system F family protein [Gammaproteobacteria bacterium]|nr:type II secretion system F family protein [Gammaproteobacteria bacterium]
MPQFYFQARDSEGKSITGTRESFSAESLARLLVEEGHTPITIQVIKEKREWNFNLKPAVSQDDIFIFFQQISALIQAGIPLITALQRIAETTKNTKFKKVLFQIMTSLNEGASFSRAMQNHPKLFTPVVYNLVRIGEESGGLVDILKQLIDHLVFEDMTRKRILTALRYPLTVLIVILLTLIIINLFVIPVFANMYSGLHLHLPLPTRILIGFSNFIRTYGILSLLSCLILGFALARCLKQAHWQYIISKWTLKAPIFGDIISRILLARFARTLGLIYRSGIPLIDGLTLVSDSTPNAYVAHSLMALRDHLIQGENLSYAAAKLALFSPVVIQMLAVGEQTGALDKILFQVAEYYETSIDYDIKRLADRLEPILLIGVGGLILLIALSIFMPMWNMVSLINPIKQ